MDMTEPKRPLDLVAIGILALLTLIALAMILSDLQGWL